MNLSKTGDTVWLIHGFVYINKLVGRYDYRVYRSTICDKNVYRIEELESDFMSGMDDIKLIYPQIKRFGQFVHGSELGRVSGHFVVEDSYICGEMIEVSGCQEVSDNVMVIGSKIKDNMRKLLVKNRDISNLFLEKINDKRN